MFGFGDKVEAKTTVDDTEASKSGVWGSQLSEAMRAARKGRMEHAEGTTGKRSASQGAKGGGGLSAAMSEAARKMFEPDQWRTIVRSPFALGKVMTGRDCWELEKKQEDQLAVSTSATAEYFMNTDPKWIMLTLCMFNWSVILTEKYVANAKQRNLEKGSEPQQPVHPQDSTGKTLNLVS